MAAEFIEITTFGSLFRFAMTLEECALRFIEQLDDQELQATLAKRHQKRLKRLEETRRERLNEVTLEPLYDIDGSSYQDFGGDDDHPIERLLKLQERSERFYLDSARIAENMLAEISKIFKRLAKENKKSHALLASP